MQYPWIGNCQRLKNEEIINGLASEMGIQCRVSDTSLFPSDKDQPKMKVILSTTTISKY